MATPRPATLRVSFELINLPIRQPMQVGPFTFTPVPKVEEVLRQLQRSFQPSEVTAIGSYSPDPSLTPPQAFQRFTQQMRIIELLLSFANRCHIEAVNPRVESSQNSSWRFEYCALYLFRDGRAQPAPWYQNQLALADFVDRQYHRLKHSGFADETGVPLTLLFYEQAGDEERLEMQFLNYWMAFEILYSRHAAQAGSAIVAPEPFEMIRIEFGTILDQMVASKVIDREQRTQLKNRVAAFNDPSKSREHKQSDAFLKAIVAPYRMEAEERSGDLQEVTPREINHFYQIRNEIVHEGWMNPKRFNIEEDDQALCVTIDLDEQVQRLRSLLERVILARLDERPNLMFVSWRKRFVTA